MNPIYSNNITIKMCGIFALFGSPDINQCQKSLDTLIPRGPDNSKIVSTSSFFLGFRRLAINDLSCAGDQPMSENNVYMMCNGEIYNHLEIQEEYNIKCSSKSDCEIILRAYCNGVKVDELCEMINGDFAFIIVDGDKKILGRDRVGLRPLFYGFSDVQDLVVASEIKAMSMCKNINHVAPGYVYNFSPKNDLTGICYFNPHLLFQRDFPARGELRNLLQNAVKLRTESDRPIGCLLSGGLDSTIITFLLTKLLGPKNVRTYSIGMVGSIDLQYARKVSDFLHTQHTEIIFTPEEGIAVIPDVIKALESYDITTVRASVGMYLLGKFISTYSDDKVIFSGELSDELLCGYLYFHHAPSDKHAEDESNRLISNVHKYDALRADRCISSHGLELRAPFADKYVIDYCMSLSGNIKRPKDGVEKRHLREQFIGDIPYDILWRRKDGFSDGVSSMDKPWYTYIQEFLEDKIDLPLPDGIVSKEEMYYRQIYNSLYPYYPNPIDDHWMPKWVNVDKSNPSGRIINL